MAETTAKQRPGANMRLIEATQYRLPPAAVVSILHRVSGILMFVLLPFVIWLLDKSLTSEVSYSAFTSVFVSGLWVFPAILVKLVVLALIWAYLHHFIAGLRHLWMDATHSVSKEFGRSSALVTLGVSIVLTLALGFKLFF
ncbi:succinate dehydrogenase, cytochrome b556 subunit [Piscinibacter gummiphilus]|uniref:Succinate dehydrogenase cytochrome b556 subunit n=1 Tax=Piscinibacter gummiphilus TaxID=946333 RepID=A0ABZ0D547_9BURK|nr:succinate dehydrogenase, cytochrome b556 subunit [Piscinibacter gummiphilus]WOB10168.1 succinate dehydrogenase, cytochrome b556 subunit [Piscinibacter gummiphilus]